MGNIQAVGPNEALIVSGGCCRPSRKQIIVGGWCWSTWMLTNIQRISLQVMTLNPKCEHVQSSQGVPVTVTGVVHCKIMSGKDFLPLAAEQFLGKSIEHIKSVVLLTVEGHMRAVIGTQDINDICTKRQDLAHLIREAATSDLTKMGIDILSLTIKDIRDDVEYLSSSGKKTTAEKKQAAAIQVARAESEAAENDAKRKQEREATEIRNETKLTEMRDQMDKSVVTLKSDLGQLKAQAEKAYNLELARIHRDIKSKQMELKQVEMDRMVEIEREESERIRGELEMEIELPTKYEVYEIDKRAAAAKAKCESELEAEKFRIACQGKARAEAIKLEGEAEAQGLRLLAEARRDFNDAANLFEVLKVLPEVAAELAAPLNKFEDIVLISDGQPRGQDAKVTGADLARLQASLPVAMRAVGGSDSASQGFLKSIISGQPTTKVK